MEFKNYKFRDGFNFKADANKVGKYIERLAKTNNNEVTPQLLLDKAKNTKSPVHHLFEWDDTKASEKYRLWQSRHLLGSLVVEINIGEPQNVRAFVSITMPNNTQGYYSISDVSNDNFKLEMVINDAKQRLLKISNQIKVYEKLKPSAQKIEEIVEQMKVN